MSQTIAFVLLCGVLLIAGATDWCRGKVYNWLTYPAIAVGLLYWTIAGLLGAEPGFVAALIGTLAGFVPFTAIYLAGGLGGGDVKLMTAVGALSASWACVLSTTVYALLAAVAMAVVVMIRHGLVRRTLSRLFGAALQAAGRVSPTFPADSPRIPFSTAIALGGILAGGEQLLGWQTPWRWLAP